MTNGTMSRRSLLGGAVGMAGLAAVPALAQDGTTEFTAPVSSSVRNNISSFRMLQWQEYFDNTRGGAILVDISSRALHFWSEDQSTKKEVQIRGGLNSGVDLNPHSDEEQQMPRGGAHPLPSQPRS